MYNHGRHLEGKSGGGWDNWVIKIFGVTNCKCPRHEAMLWGVGCGCLKCFEK